MTAGVLAAAGWKRLFVALGVVAAWLVSMRWYFFTGPLLDGDTGVLWQGARELEYCWQWNADRCEGVWHFPLLQYIEAVWFIRHENRQPMQTFSSFSALALIALLVAGAVFLWRQGRRGSAVFFVLGLLSSFALWHVNSTYGELQGAALIVFFTVASLSRRSAIAVAVFACAASITKEIAPAMLLPMGLVPLLRQEGPWRARLRKDARFLAALALGLGTGAVLNARFNLLRFGSVRNTYLLDPAFRVQTVKQLLIQTVGEWISPNGGMVLFAPLIVLAVFIGVFAAVRRPVTRPELPSRAAALLPFAYLTVLAFGFGSWFSPFGWWTWGPRLILPWLPAVLLLALWLEGERLEQLLSRALTRVPVAGVLAVAVVGFALPHVAMLSGPDIFYSFMMGAKDCPNLPDYHQFEAYYACHNARVFATQDIMPLRTFGILGREGLRGSVVLYCGVLLALCAWLRHEVTRSP